MSEGLQLLRGCRLRAGLTQDDLGTELGLSGTGVCRLERGERRLTLQSAVLYARACQMSDAEWIALRALVLRESDSPARPMTRLHDPEAA